MLVPGSPGGADMLDLRPECALQALHLSCTGSGHSELEIPHPETSEVVTF